MFSETAGYSNSSDPSYKSFLSVFSEDGFIFATFTAELCGKLLNN